MTIPMAMTAFATKRIAARRSRAPSSPLPMPE